MEWPESLLAALIAGVSIGTGGVPILIGVLNFNDIAISTYDDYKDTEGH